MSSLPLTIVLDIIKNVLDGKYLPIKYKLSLGLINKRCFKLISDNYCHELYLSNTDVRNIKKEVIKHLNNPLSPLKIIKRLRIQENMEKEKEGNDLGDLIPFLKNVEYLSITGRYIKEIPINSEIFPNLKDLVMATSSLTQSEISDLTITQPPNTLESFVLTFDRSSDSPVFLKILKSLDLNTLKSLGIDFWNDNGDITELQTFLNEYPIGHLENLDCPDDILGITNNTYLRHSKSLKIIKFYDLPYENGILESYKFENLVNLKIFLHGNISQLPLILTAINEKPKLTNLDLYCSSLTENSNWIELKYVEELQLSASNSVLNGFFKANINNKLRSLTLSIVSQDDEHVEYSSEEFKEFAKNNHYLRFLKLTLPVSNVMGKIGIELSKILYDLSTKNCRTFDFSLMYFNSFQMDNEITLFKDIDFTETMLEHIIIYDGKQLFKKTPFKPFQCSHEKSGELFFTRYFLEYSSKPNKAVVFFKTLFKSSK